MPIAALAIVVVSDLLNRGMILLYAAVVARQLSKADYGVFALGVQIANIAWIFADLGITALSVRRVAVQSPDEQRSTLLSVTITRFMLACGVVLICFSLSFFVPLSAGELHAYLGGILAILANSLLPNWFMRGTQDNAGYLKTYLMLGIGVLGAVGVIGLFPVPNAQWATTIRSGALVLGATFAYFVAFRRIRLPGSRMEVDLRGSFDLLRTSAPLSIAGLLVVLSQSTPLFIVRGEWSLQELAHQAVVWQLLLVSLSLLSSIQLVFAPRHAKARKDSADTLDASYRAHIDFNIVLSAVGMVGALFLGEPVMTLLFGSKYSASSNLLPVAALVASMYMIRTMLGNHLILEERMSRMLFSASAAYAVNIVLGAVLIAKGSEYSPLLVLFASETVLSIGYFKALSGCRLRLRTYLRMFGVVLLPVILWFGAGLL